MSKTYKINPEFAFSTNDSGEVNIINLGEDDNMYVLNKVSAQVFPKLVDGESPENIAKYIASIDGSPSPEEIDNFLKKFIDDLTDLKIIQKRL